MGVLRQRILLAAMTASMLMVSSCVDEKEGSLFDPNRTFGAAPVLTAISPPDSAQAGVDTLAITGSNFSTFTGDNVVFFNATPAALMQSTATQLTMKAPFVLGDSVLVRVAVRGSDVLSNGLTYRLQAAITSFGLLGQDDLANALITDAAGDAYVSVSVGGTGQGIKKILSDGSVTAYASDTTGVTGWNSLKFGPGGYLYAARGIRAIYRFMPGGGAAAVLWTSFPSGVTINDIDFDQNQILWAAGSNTTNINNARVYSVSQTPTTKSFPFAASVRSVRVFNSSLYMAAFKDSAWGIWRAPISADSIGTPELYFAFEASFPPGYIPQALTFAANGTLYIATNAPDGFVLVTPSKAAVTPYSDYQGLFGTSVRFLAWGPGLNLFATTAEGVLFKLNARTTGAPYY
ncbi:MAG: IPT/TIG domain-containing protein [Ignavibacteriales bacterium]|nr:IPT/TIG domain-containing protein [Ignavibacteriales bacterium]